MIAILKGLDEAMAEEIRIERELVSVGTRKRDALVALDMKGVEQATVRERTLLSALGPAAERRLHRTAEAARTLGLSEDGGAVTRIAQESSEPMRTQLLERAGELRRALQDLARVNGANKALTEQSLSHVKQFFRLLGGAGEEPVYTRRGLETSREIPKVMIDEVA